MNAVVFVPLDRGERRSGAALLRHGGFPVEVSGTLERALRVVRKRHPAAVVVAVDAGESAAAVSTLRRGTDAPMLVLSRQATEAEKVGALDAGADDYVTSPYGVDELLARMRALLRRASEHEAVDPIVTDDFSVDVAARRLRRVEGGEVLLTAVEWRVLEVLLRRPGHLVTREELLRDVWGPKGLEEPHYLRVYVSRLRQKLEPDPHAPRYVMTVFGLGVYFRVDGVASEEVDSGAMMGA